MWSACSGTWSTTNVSVGANRSPSRFPTMLRSRPFALARAAVVAACSVGSPSTV
jgi:hypothetical protein